MPTIPPILTSRYIPRISDWRITFFNNGDLLEPLFVYTKDNPGTIIEQSLSLSAIGTLESARLTLSAHPQPIEPFSQSILFEVLPLGEIEWVRLGEGYYVNTDEQGGLSGSTWSVEIEGLHKLIERGYFFQSSEGVVPLQPTVVNVLSPVANPPDYLLPPRIPGIATETFNMLPTGIPEEFLGKWEAKVSEVFGSVFEEYSNAAWGVDPYRRVILGQSSSGIQTVIDAEIILDLSPQNYDITDYTTNSRSRSGAGWAQAEFNRSTPPLVPRVAEDATAPEPTDQTGPIGAQLTDAQYRKLFTTEPKFNTDGTPKLDPDTGLEVRGPLEPRPLRWGGTTNYDLPDEGFGGAIGLVYDFQSWYENSALIKTNQSTYEPQSATITLGWTPLDVPDNALVSRLLEVFDAQTQSYSYNYVPLEQVYAIVVDVAMWCSLSPTFDPEAIGEPDPEGSIVEPSPLHPAQSSKKIYTLQSERWRYYTFDEEKVLAGTFDIPAEMLTKDFAKEQLDGKRWFLHIAVSWFVEQPFISTYGS